jgi:multiple sugar transport system permease protein
MQQPDTASRRSPLAWLDSTFQYWALAPAVLLFAVLTLYPVANLLRMSVSTIDFAKGEFVWTFAGAKNLLTLADDWLFRIALRNTLSFVAAAVVLEMVLGFLLALVASQVTAGSGVYRTILVIPILVPAVAIGCMWKLMYNYEFGIINQILTALRLPGQAWLADVNMAMPAVILVDVWHWVPFVFLILLAGLESLPVEVLEAASVDGANGWQRLWHVIMPLVWPTFSVALMFRTIFAFKVFDEVFLLTSGGPGTSTEVVSLYIYQVFFSENRMGYGALLSIVTIAIISLFVIVYRRTGRSEV